MFNLDDNTKEMISYMLVMCGEMFKIFMATLLLVFVPQYCEDTGEKMLY